MSSTLFEKICAGEIPADIVYQDDQCVCFRDIGPQAPTHLLLVPRKPIPRLSLADEGDAALLGHMMLAAGKIARSLGIDESGFRLVINNGALSACQARNQPVRCIYEKIAGRA